MQQCDSCPNIDGAPTCLCPYTDEHHKQKLDAALDDLRKEANLILRSIDAKVIPTLKQLESLNKVASYLYFILNGC